MKVTLIGCGEMGSLFAKKLSSGHTLYLCDHNEEKVDHLVNLGFGQKASDVKEASLTSDVIILAVKPHHLDQVRDILEGSLKESQIFFSVLAGVTVAALKNAFSPARLYRLMPNSAIISDEGMIGITTEEALSSKEKEPITSFLEPLGKLYWLSEDKMDAFTAIASCGPAFFFSMMEAMTEAGLLMGLSAKETMQYLSHMIRGSITLVETTKKSTSELIYQITSPQGATIAGLRCLEEEGIRAGLINTFLAAFNRIQGLSDNN